MTADAGHIRMPISECVGNVTATITVMGVRRFSVRFWLGMQLLCLASWVLPVRTNVEVKQ